MKPPNARSNFAENVKLLTRLHEMLRQGNDDEEADDLRDQMDAHWLKLTEDEKKLVRGLSADLKTLGVDRPAPTSDPDEDIWCLFSDAVTREDWQAALEHVRSVERELAPSQLAYIRGACWAYLSQPHVAIIFFQEKNRLEPLNGAEEVLLLTCMIEGDRLDEAIEKVHEIVTREHEPALLLKAAEVLFLEASQSQDSESETRHRNASEIARRGLELGEAAAPDELFESLRLGAYLHMALSYDQLGEKDEAIRCCEVALKLDPNHFDARMLHACLTNGEFPRSEQHRRLVAAPRILPMRADLIGSKS